MKKFMDKLAAQWTDVANLILGIWLAVSPMVLSYMADTTPAANASIVGIIIIVSAGAALISFHEWEEWVNVALAAWLIASPWLLDYAAHTTALWNQIITGVSVCALALGSALAAHKGGVAA